MATAKNDGAPAVSIAVLGAGSWGTALAMQLARAGNLTTLWARDAKHAADIKTSGENHRYLPNIPLPDELRVTDSLEQAVTSHDLILCVPPSHGFRGLLQAIKPFASRLSGIAWASKGFEPGTGRLLHQVAEDQFPGMPLAVVTGPSFAKEVALDLPTAVTVAGNNKAFARQIAGAFHDGSFRAYTSPDMAGAELGGAVKNVMAVATGICDGMALGDNARAALVTRGMAEMMRLGHAMGARKETLMGLAGMGDLVLTCTGDLSRNRRLGLALGRGQSVADAEAEIGQVVEGIGTATEVWRLAQKHDVEMPITEQVHGIIHKGWDPETGVRVLLGRQPKQETD